MTRKTLVAAVIFAAATAQTALVCAQDKSPGWTGVTNPGDVIAARQAQMIELERLMRPIDSSTVGESVDPEMLRSAAMTISSILLTTPHLFPPTTNLYDAAAEVPVTTALPAIWEDFEAFAALASAAVAAADSLASATQDASLSTGATNLRGSCDACHAVFLLPYERSTVTSEDVDFDFDTFFDDIADDPQ